MEWKPILAGAWQTLRDVVSALWQFLSKVALKLVDFVIWLVEHLVQFGKGHAKAAALLVGALSGAGATVLLRPPPAQPAPVEVRAPIEAHLVSVGSGQLNAGDSVATLSIPQTLLSSQQTVEKAMDALLKECTLAGADETRIRQALEDFKTEQGDEQAMNPPYTAYHKGPPDRVEEGDGTKVLNQKLETDYQTLVGDLKDLDGDKKPECTNLASLYGAWQGYTTQVNGLFPFDLNTEVPGAVIDPHPIQQDIGKGALIARVTPEPTAPPGK